MSLPNVKLSLFHQCRISFASLTNSTNSIHGVELIWNEDRANPWWVLFRCSTLNGREETLLLEDDNKYNELFLSEEIMKECERLPKK